MKVIDTFHNALLTDRKKENRKEDIDIYVDFTTMMSQENAMQTKVEDILMKKYRKASRCSIYNIRKRVEGRLKRGELIIEE